MSMLWEDKAKGQGCLSLNPHSLEGSTGKEDQAQTQNIKSSLQILQVPVKKVLSIPKTVEDIYVYVFPQKYFAKFNHFYMGLIL